MTVEHTVRATCSCTLTAFTYHLGAASAQVTFLADYRLASQIGALAARDGLPHAVVLARAIEAYQLILVPSPSQAGGQLRLTFPVTPRLRAEIRGIRRKTGLTSAVLLARAIAAYGVMYPGRGYQPAERTRDVPGRPSVLA